MGKFPIALIAAASLGACEHNRDRVQPQGDAGPDSAASIVADTAVIRGPGVPTDADDTLGTRYGKHEAPRAVQAPECLPHGTAQCITDTAATVRSVECCMNDQRETRWLVFAAAGDSMQLFLFPDGSYLDMEPPSAEKFIAEHSHGADATWIRPRFGHSGAYVFTVGIESDDLFQLGHQLSHCRLGEPGELQPGRIARYTAQRQHVVPLRHRARDPDKQQRHLLHRSRQPAPQDNAGLIGPLQVVDDQDGRPDRALLGDQSQQLLRQYGGYVRAAVDADLAAQDLDDRLPPGIGRRFSHPQSVEKRQQRQRLAQLVTGTPEHLAASFWRLRHGRPYQCGLANARLTLDEDRTASPPRHVSYQPSQQRHLAVAADQCTGRGHRLHGGNCTT